MPSPEMQTMINELQVQFPFLQIGWAGGICPFQSEGTMHGLPYYFRYRGGNASLRVGVEDGEMWFKPLYSAQTSFGHPLDGFLSPEEFRQLLTQLIGELERSEIYWEFPGIEPKDIGRVKAGTPRTYGAWAHTPEEAWERLHTMSVYLRSHGYTEERYAAMMAEQQMSPETVTVDDRVFPDPNPFEREEQHRG